MPSTLIGGDFFDLRENSLWATDPHGIIIALSPEIAADDNIICPVIL